ncbi:MAG: signal recognition particle receptor subunit alpha [Candidatus Pacearchaeota archaeon]
MLEKLSNTLKKTTDKIANALFLDKNLVESIIKDLQRSLIEADVNVHLVLELSNKIKKAAYDERIKGLEKKEHLLKVLYEELKKIIGEKKEIEIKNKNIWLFLGLYGQGKTTTIAKIASYYSKRGNKVCTVGLDVHRPAAAEQLKQLSDKIGITCFIDTNEKDPIKIWKKYEKEIESYKIILVDTAGRDALSEELIKEIEKIKNVIKPTEIILTISADIGQTAKKQAEKFKETVEITGVIVTKMDSTAKGGGALSACAEAKAPILFIGTGEKMHEIETFDPESFLSRLLGKGDLKSLIEKIYSIADQEKIKETQKKIEQGKFTLRELQEQLSVMDKMDSFDKIISLIPGLEIAKIKKEEINKQQEKTKRWKYAIDSMTKEEIENPEIIEKETSRMQRISKGSGVPTSDIRAMIKQYKLLKEMINEKISAREEKIDQKTMMKLARKFAKKIKF